MIINSTDISTYNARQHKVIYGYPERNASYEWPTGGANPVWHRNMPETETVTVELIVKGSSRDWIQSNIRQILGLFNAAFVNIYFTGGGWFLGTLQGISVQETSPQKWHKLILTLRGIVYQEIVGAGMIRTLPASFSEDASPIGGCQGILALTSNIDVSATITVSGLSRDRKGKDHNISFEITIPGDGTSVTVYIGELPAGLPFFTAHENPTMLSLADGTPICGSIGSVPSLKQGQNTVSVTASDLSNNAARIRCDFTVYSLSTKKVVEA